MCLHVNLSFIIDKQVEKKPTHPPGLKGTVSEKSYAIARSSASPQSEGMSFLGYREGGYIVCRSFHSHYKADIIWLLPIMPTHPHF